MTSAPLLVQSFAKVNLALAVLHKRADGYHEIRTVFQTIDLHDELELRPCGGLELDCVGLSLPAQANLVWKAASALQEAVPGSYGARIVLRKRIPSGAGLGGGSSNAAATLLGLFRLWGLDPDAVDLTKIAATLGSDVPFFLQGGTALGIGRGDEIYPLTEIKPPQLLVVFPGIQVSTAEAYHLLNLPLTSDRKTHKMQRFCGGLGTEDPPRIFNDFETSILPAYPPVREAVDFLNERGATAVLLSGSGSSVFGFFCDEESALAASRAVTRESWRVFPAKTLSRAEYQQRIFG